MRRPVQIDGPILTVNQVARMMGVSQKRVKELAKLLEDIKRRKPARRHDATRVRTSAARNRTRGR